jgi:hypothetical protein
VSAQLISNIVASLALVVAVLAVAIAWAQTQIAKDARDTALRALHVAYRPYVSIAVYQIEGTGRDLVNFASVLHNHGNVPATIVDAWCRVAGGGDLLAAGSQLQPNQIPSQLCIFPGQDAELTWGAAAVSFIRWPHGGFLQILVEIVYRGALKTKYMTSLEANYALPDANIPGRSPTPMDIRRAEAT